MRKNKHFAIFNKLKIFIIVVMDLIMRKIIITEEQAKQLAQTLREEVYQMPVDKKANKPYTINPERVLIVKKFIDSNFKKGSLERIGNDGLKETVPIISIMGSDGKALKNLYKEDLCGILIEKFKNMFLDKIERELFMKQLVNDWFDNKITIFGMLSVNHL